MPDVFGSAYSGSDPLHRAPGTVVDAAARRFRNVFDLAADGGAQNDLVAAKVREGVSVFEARMHSTVSLAAITFTIGTDADPDKYGAASAGPAAGASKTFQLTLASLDDDALGSPETIKFFPSAALPGAGIVVTEIFASKR